MERVYTELSLDFNDNDSMLMVNVQQGDDNGRVIELKLYDNGERVNVGLSDTATLNASCGGVITAAGENCNIQNNKVAVLVTDDLTAIPGIEHCVVRITSATGTIHTARFVLNVGPDPASTAVPAIIATSSLLDRLEALEAVSATHVSSSDVSNIVKLTQAQYDALTIKNATTLYIIVENQA